MGFIPEELNGDNKMIGNRGKTYAGRSNRQ
jgi:hypothetical protein